ncbi:hypothetical protein ABPG75_006277 [Micractinium tetrahymenae]
MRLALLFVTLLALEAGCLAGTRSLLQGGGGGAPAPGGGGQAAVSTLPQFLLPPVPPQASAQLLAVLGSFAGNLNSFANAVQAASQVAGQTGVAKAFSDAIAAGNATQLLTAIASATAFGSSSLTSLMNGAFAQAVADEVGRGNVQQAAEAIAGTFTLAGGPGPALAAVQQLGSIVQAVGCTTPLTDILSAATGLVTGAGNCTYAGRGQTFAYTVSQQPSLAGCWSSIAGPAAGGLLSAIQPIIILSQAPGAEAAAGGAPAAAVAPSTSELAAAGPSGATAVPPSTAAPSAGPATTSGTAPTGQAPAPSPSGPTATALPAALVPSQQTG